MKILILSHFDTQYGPRILFKAPESLTEVDFDLNQIPSLMDLHEKGFFVHITEEFKSANILFEINSVYARGNREMLLISLLLSENDEDININISKEFLEGFQKEIEKIEKGFKAFYVDSTKYKGDPNKLSLIRSIFYTFNESFISALEAVRTAEIRFQALFKAARDAILIIDHDSSVIIDGNEQVEKIFEISLTHLIGMELNQIPIQFPGKKDYFINKISEQIQVDNAPPLLMRIQNANGKSIPIEVNANEIQMSGKNLIQCIIRDVTEREKAEEALRNAYERENFYKDLFMHDFNNIISNILSSLQLYSIYKNDINRHEKTKETIEIIREQSIRGSNLISNIRKLSEIEDIKLNIEKVEVFEILGKVLNYIPNVFKGKQINIYPKSRTKKEFVKANNLLSDVFKNILINAINHNNNANVEIIIQFSKVQEEEISYLKIEFIDNGIGIEDERKKNIFQKGLSKNVRGIGLGLYLVRSIIENYNGHIFVEDRVDGKPSEGAKFVVLIPQA